MPTWRVALKLLVAVAGYEELWFGLDRRGATGDRKIPPCITVFSAPNYCDLYRNKASFLKLTDEGYSLSQLTWVSHPFYLPNFANGLQASLGRPLFLSPALMQRARAVGHAVFVEQGAWRCVVCARCLTAHVQLWEQFEKLAKEALGPEAKTREEKDALEVTPHSPSELPHDARRAGRPSWPTCASGITKCTSCARCGDLLRFHPAR